MGPGWDDARVRLDVPTLHGDLVRLEPLQPGHVPGLTAAAAEDRRTYAWTSVPDGEAAVRAHVADLTAAREAGTAVPFAQVRPRDGRVLGATRYLSPRALAGSEEPYAVEVGGTWLAASAQRSGVNTEAKLLLLGHAFEVWGVARVDLRTDARNARSRAAIEALGATFEGVLRRSQRSYAVGEDGALRDSAVFSVIAPEWPQVRDRLRVALRRPG